MCTVDAVNTGGDGGRVVVMVMMMVMGVQYADVWGNKKEPNKLSTMGNDESEDIGHGRLCEHTRDIEAISCG